MSTIRANNIKVLEIPKINALGIASSEKRGISYEDSNTYYHKFLPYAGLNKLLEDYNDPKFLKNHNDVDLLIFYLSGSKNELYITITGRSKDYNKILESKQVLEYKEINSKLTFKEYVINRIINDTKEAFLFTYDEILQAINDAISDYNFIVSENNTRQESRFTTPSHLLKNKIDLQNRGVLKLLQEVNRTIAKMRAEEKYAYNEWIMSVADPHNYFWLHSNDNKDISAKDLKRLIDQLKNYKKNIGDLNNGRIKSIEDMASFVEENLTAGGSMFKWFIDTPFFGLDAEQRRKYIEMYCVKEESAFPRLSISGGISNGDIVAALFKTCSNKQDLFDIIICLEQEGKLFHLLNNLKFDAFSQVCTIITSVYMTYIKKGEIHKKYAEALEFGRQILFDNRTFGNRNTEEFDTVHNKLKFTSDLNLFVKIGKATPAAPFLADMTTEDLQKPISCNPLDLISITPVEDIERYKLKAGEIYMLPACFVYLLYNEETWETAILAAEVTLQLAFCLIGVGEIMAAVEAGSTIGVAYSAAGVAIDFNFGVTLFKEFRKDHPLITKYIHYAMWARLVSDFINVKGLSQELRASVKANRINIESYEVIKDDVKIIKGIQKTYKPLSLPQVFPSVIFPPAVTALYGLSSATRRIMFTIEKVIQSQKSVTIFFKGAEVFTGGRSAAKEFLDTAVVVYKNEGQAAIENFFFAKQSSNEIRLLHSQTGETPVGKLIRKKNSEGYSYELHDLNIQLHYKKNWTVKEINELDRFKCDVFVISENGKNYYSGDFMVAPNLNTTLQANKTGLSDVSLGEVMYNDGFAVLRKDLGKDFDGIYGHYVKNDSYVAFGGESLNLTKFKKAMLGKQITKENIIEAVKQINPYKMAKSKGYDKIELKTTMTEFENLQNNDIMNLNELEVIYYK